MSSFSEHLEGSCPNQKWIAPLRYGDVGFFFMPIVGSDLSLRRPPPTVESRYSRTPAVRIPGSTA